MATIAESLTAGWTFHRAGDLSRAAGIYREVLEADPANAHAWCLLGAIHHAQGDHDATISSYEIALRLEPNHAEARNNLGFALAVQGLTDEAIAHYREALRIKPEYADAYNNLGTALHVVGEIDEAIACYERAIELDCAHADAHHNLGILRRATGRLDEALASYERALWIAPDRPQFHLSLGILLIAMGDFERGWREYEWRWRCPEFSLPSFHQPIWDGSPLRGRTILLYPDHGMGDTIQFIRYAPIIKRMGGRVIACCQRPIARVLATCPGIDQLVTEGDPTPAFDVYVPLMSLPRILGTTVNTVPADVPYLHADPRLVDRWRDELRPFEGFKIGVAWQGNPQYPNDRDRSFPLSALEPIARLPGVRLFSLQRGLGREQIEAHAESLGLIDLAGRFTDFMDNAAAMRSLDLVIVPDTSLSHLAGSLGVPVWLALCLAPDPRWMTGREDSVWYPRHRLFRQTAPGHWDDVFARMAAELRSRLPSRSAEAADT